MMMTVSKHVHCMFCVTVLPAFLKVLLIVMFKTQCNIYNVCMLSFTVLPDSLTSFFLFLLFTVLLIVCCICIGCAPFWRNKE